MQGQAAQATLGGNTAKQRAPHPVIVHYGRDQSLLRTRILLLESAGHDVSSALEPADIDRLLGPDSSGVLVVCHSLPEDQREAAFQKIQSHWPGMKGLLVTQSTTPLSKYQVDTLSNSEGPGALVARARDLLS